MVPKEVHTSAPMNSSTPISPEERSIPYGEWMQEHADLARLGRRTPIPLALLTKRTGAATLDAGSVHHTQAAIGFSAVFMWSQVLVCRAPKCSIGLERKILA